MKKTLMALAAVATLAVSAVRCRPAHAQRGVAAGVAAGLIGGAIVGGAIASHAITVGPWLLWPGLWLLRRPGLCRRSRLWRLLLATPALLGRLWLAGPQRPGLRLSPFTFIKSRRHSRKTAVFRDALIIGQKKPFFSANSLQRLLWIDCCALL